MNAELTEEQLRALFAWIDAIPLSRPKRNIARDFSDGVLLAEVVHAYFPHLVELHNYTATSSVKQKIYNFDTLNKKVLKKIGHTVPRELVEDAVNCKPGAIESILNTLQLKMAKYREKRLSETTNSRDDDTTSPKSTRGTFGNSGTSNNNNTDNDRKAPSAAVQQLLDNKDAQIRELQESIEILQLKVSKLEQLVQLKDLKLQKLTHGL